MLDSEIVCGHHGDDELAECRAELRAMASRLSQAEDDERARIARGLHDDVGQILAAVMISLGELDRSADDGVRRLNEEIQSLVNEAVESVRTLTFELRVPVMPQIGIGSQLEQLAPGLVEQHGIACHFYDDDQPKPLSAEVAGTLLRVCSELLHNITKHAGANSVRVEVTRVVDRIRVIVSDDGIGFRPHMPPVPERAGFGLLIVRERLALVGGDIEIDSGSNSGTRIVVTAPLLMDDSETR